MSSLSYHCKLVPILTAIFTALFCSNALACTLVEPNPSADFGNWSSIGIQSATPTTEAIPSAGLECEGALVGALGGLFGSDYIEATINGLNTTGSLFHLTHSEGDALSFKAFADPNFQEEIHPGATYNYSNAYLLELLGLLGTGNSAELPIFFRIDSAAGANLQPGLYTDTLTINWNWSRCKGVDVGGLVCILFATGTATTLIDIQLMIEADCIVQAPQASFGSAPLVAAFNELTQTIEIRCSKSQSYSVGLNLGLHQHSSERRLNLGAHYLVYDIFKGPSGVESWGHIESNRRNSAAADINPGQYDGIGMQGFIYRAVIRPNQATPPVGIYHDTVVIDVAF